MCGVPECTARRYKRRCSGDPRQCCQTKGFASPSTLTCSSEAPPGLQRFFAAWGEVQGQRSVSESWRNRQMLAKSGQKTALAGDWPKAIASQGWLNEGRRRGDIASASPAPMTDIANILRRNGQFSSGTSLHSVKQAPACWGLRPQSPKREASADKATAAPHVAAALCQAQGWLPRISPILNVPSPADWRNLDATAVLIARPSPKLPRGPETLGQRKLRVAPALARAPGHLVRTFGKDKSKQISRCDGANVTSVDTLPTWPL